MFAQALERARFLDEYRQREEKVFGPLHGLPISLKDTFCIKGLQTSAGYVSFLENGVQDENSPLVDMLLDLGAVLYVKTNIPQTLMVSFALLLFWSIVRAYESRRLIRRITSTAAFSIRTTRTSRLGDRAEAKGRLLPFGALFLVWELMLRGLSGFQRCAMGLTASNRLQSAFRLGGRSPVSSKKRR